MSVPLSIYNLFPKRMPLSLGFSIYSLSFDGDDYVTLGNVLNWGATDSFTLTAWFKTSLSGVAQGIICKYPTGPNEYRVFIDTDDRLFFIVRDAGGGILSISGLGPIVTDGRWHHVAAVRDKSVNKGFLYVDGALVNPGGTSEDSGAITTTAPLLIGARTTDSWFFTGPIDEVCFYRRALSLGEIRYNILNYHNPIKSDMVLWLPMEEGVGTIVYDKSGYGNNGTIYGASWTKVKMWELRAEAGL